MKQKAVLVDIDNCYMDSRELIAKHNGDWEEFGKNIPNLSVPNKPFIDGLIELIKTVNILPIFTTGREDNGNVLSDSIKQIDEGSNGVFVVGKTCFLMLREKNDFRKGVLVKKDMLDAIRNYYDPIVAIDDDMDICQMYVENGIAKVFHYNIESNEFQEISA